MSTSNTTLALALVQAGVALSPTGTAPTIAPKRKAATPKVATKAKSKGKVKAKALNATHLGTVRDIAPAAWRYAKSHGEVAALVKAIGKNATAGKAVQRAFYIGFIAQRVLPDALSLTAPAEALAVAIIDAAGIDAKKLADGQMRRNKAQETVYGAARKAWSRIIGEAKAKPMDKRGASSKRAARTPTATSDATNDMLQATPKAKDKAGVSSYLLQQSATMLAYINKNAKLVTPQQSSAVSDFHAAIKAIEEAPIAF